MQMPRLFLHTIAGSCFAHARTSWLWWASRFVHVLAGASSILFDDNYSSFSRRCYRLKMIFFLSKAIAWPCASFLLPHLTCHICLEIDFRTEHIYLHVHVVWHWVIGKYFLRRRRRIQKVQRMREAYSIVRSFSSTSVWSIKRAARGNVDLLLFFIFALRNASMIQCFIFFSAEIIRRLIEWESCWWSVPTHCCQSLFGRAATANHLCSKETHVDAQTSDQRIDPFGEGDDQTSENRRISRTKFHVNRPLSNLAHQLRTKCHRCSVHSDDRTNLPGRLDPLWTVHFFAFSFDSFDECIDHSDWIGHSNFYRRPWANYIW